FGTRSLDGFGCADMAAGIAAAGALLQYVIDTQKTALPHIRAIVAERASEAVLMDAATRRNLELEESLSGRAEHTLAGVMDRCKSPMGSRTLRRWLQRPLRSREVLLGRYQAVQTILDDGTGEMLRGLLEGIGDVERILA